MGSSIKRPFVKENPLKGPLSRNRLPPSRKGCLFLQRTQRRSARLLVEFPVFSAPDVSEEKCQQISQLHQSSIRLKVVCVNHNGFTQTPVRLYGPRESSVPCRVQSMDVTDSMVMSQPFRGSRHGQQKNWKSLGGTAANQAWWFFQPLVWFTVPANP
jgi:hypothetical protein